VRALLATVAAVIFAIARLAAGAAQFSRPRRAPGAEDTMSQRNSLRIGILLPPANTAMEDEIPPFLPPNVRVSFNRLSREGRTLTAESLLSMARSVTRAAGDLAWCEPDTIVYGCTSGTFLDGHGNEDALSRQITAETGIASVTTATAVIEALRAVRARRVFMITPYPDAVNLHEVAFLEHYGFTVGGWDSFRCDLSAQVPEITPAEVAALAQHHAEAIAGCDALFVSCTNLKVMGEIGAMEHALGVPVVTSNQASLWAALRQIGAPMAEGCGSLFQMDVPAVA
jgi:maleate isomerase